jgi:antibiotic biosynthesis monooxygenase (ABM) superfamily enzyme
MFVRCAHFVGTVAPENREKFDTFIDTEIAPIMATFPGPTSFRILRGRWYEEGAPGIYMTIELTYDRLEDIDIMLASPERSQNLEKMAQIMPLFEGGIFHINHEITAGTGI